MLLLSLLSLSCSTTVALLFAPSPIILGTLIATLALELSLMLSLVSSSWFALLLFLIYIGGLLVMFSYFVALSPNLPTPMNLPSLAFLTSLLSSQTLLCLCLPSLSFLPLTPSPSISLLSLFMVSNLPLLLFLTSTLFFALILVVKISSRTSGPLRPFSSTPL